MLSARTLTRDDGTFELQISQAGIYRIVIEAEGHLPLQSELERASRHVEGAVRSEPGRASIVERPEKTIEERRP